MTQNFNQGKKTNRIHRTLADLQIGFLMILIAGLIFTTTIYSQNLALRKPASQSSNIGSGYLPTVGLASNAVDGNTDGRWSSGSVSHTVNSRSKDPWWQVDLGRDYTVNQIRIWNRTDCCSAELTNFRIWIWSDATRKWEEFAPGLKTYIPGEKYPLVFFGNNQARYVNIRIESPSATLMLAEVEVFGPSGGPNPTPTPAGPAPGEQALWDTARQINTKAAYEQYLLSYPQGTYVKSANLALSALTGSSPTPTPTPGGDPIEAQYWAEVEKANTRDSYESYLKTYPFGPHANQARIRIGFSGGASASPTPNQANDSAKKEKEQALWETVRALNTVDGYQDFIKNYPDGVYAESARILMKSAPSATPTPAPVATPTPAPRVSADDEFWNKIKDSNRVGDFEVYLQVYPNGDHRADAMLTISRLKPAKQEPPDEKLRECRLVQTNSLNVRSETIIDPENIIGALNSRDIIFFVEERYGWTRISKKRNGEEVFSGWAASKFLDCDP